MRVPQNIYVRVGFQVGVGTMILMAIFSTPTVWDSLALSLVFPNPALIVMLFGLVMIINLGTGLAATQLAVEVVSGSLLGGCLGLAVVYLALLANNGGNTTITKASITLVLSGTGMFVLTLFRFKYRQWNMFYTLASITLALNAAGTYYQTQNQYKFILYWWMYAAISSVSAFLCSTLILPVPAGMRVRKELARALRGEGQLLVGMTKLMTGEVLGNGLLAQATGETSKRIGIDSGLFDSVATLYTTATATAVASQTAWRYLNPSKLELDLYRRQKVFPNEPYRLLCLLARGRLSTLMMLLYPLQSGRMHCGLCSQLAHPLGQLAEAFMACCEGAADVIVHGAPVAQAVEDLKAMEAAFAKLSAQARSTLRRASITQNTLALDMVLSLLFTVATRVRRMFVLLPAALGKDQPRSMAAVLSHFQASTSWDFHTITQVPPERTTSLDLLHESLLNSGLGAPSPALKRTPSAQALGLLARPSVKVLPTRKEPAGRRKTLLWAHNLWLRTGFSTNHVKLGVQMTVAYGILLIMIMIPQVNAAFDGRLPWAVLIVVAILEPSTGGVIFKGLCRFVGTVLGGLAGLGSMYFTYLCNGLNYNNHPQKFIVMTLCLGIFSGLGAAAAVKFPKYTYAFTIVVVILCVIALPGYTSDTPLPLIALWRLVTTVVGVALEVLVAMAVFPVTARDIFTDTMASTLEGMADLADTTLQSVLPAGNKQSRGSCQEAAPPLPSLHDLPQAPAPAAGGNAVKRQGGKLNDMSRRVMSCDGLERQIEQTLYHKTAAAAAVQQQQLLQQQCAEHQIRGVETGPKAGHSLVHQPSAASQLEQEANQINRQHAESAALTQQAHHTFLCREGQPVSHSYPTVAAEEKETGSSGAVAADRMPAGGPLPAEKKQHSPGQLGNSHRQSMTSQLNMPGDTRVDSLWHRPGGWTRSPSASSATAGVTPTLSNRRWSESVGVGHSQVSVERSSLRGLSVYVELAATTQKVLGSVFLRMLPQGIKAGDGIRALLQLETPLKYEFYPFSAQHRFPFDTAYRAQRLCRHMLNVLAAFAITMDSQDAREVTALVPHADRMEGLTRQLRECLLAFAGMVRGHVSMRSAVDMVITLEQHAVQLFMAVLFQGFEPDAPRVSDAETTQALAFVAMMFNATYVARLLCIALAHTFCPQELLDESASRDILNEPSRWAVGDDLMLVATGVLGMALGATSDPGTPLTMLSVHSAEVGSRGAVGDGGVENCEIEHTVSIQGDES